MQEETLQLWNLVKGCIHPIILRKAAQVFPEIAQEAEEIAKRREESAKRFTESTRSFHEQMHF